jgi:hypothetical protein
MTLRYSKQKIEAALQLLSEFTATRFPHTDSTLAVKMLSSILSLTFSQFNTASSAALTSQTEMEATALEHFPRWLNRCEQITDWWSAIASSLPLASPLWILST